MSKQYHSWKLCLFQKGLIEEKTTWSVETLLSETAKEQNNVQSPISYHTLIPLSFWIGTLRFVKATKNPSIKLQLWPQDGYDLRQFCYLSCQFLTYFGTSGWSCSDTKVSGLVYDNTLRVCAPSATLWFLTVIPWVTINKDIFSHQEPGIQKIFSLKIVLLFSY